MEQQERALIDFFEEGSKGSGNCELLGLEVERFVIWQKSVPVAYEREDTPIGVKDILEYLSAYFPERTYNSKGDLLGLTGEDRSVTLEPAAQLEISCAPYGSVADIESCYKRFRDHVGAFLGQYDAQS